MFADITSANVVGYKAEALREGFTMMTPCFVDVADDNTGLDLTKLIPSGDFASEDITIQTLTAEGRSDKFFSYYKPRRGDFRWVDNDGNDVAEGEVVFSPVQGLWVSGVDGASITPAGAVSTSDRTITLREGFTPLGNFTAVALDLTSIVPGGEIASEDVTIQTLTAEGRSDLFFSFYKPRRGDFRWVDNDGNDVAEGDVTFAPGKGLWVAGVDGATITIPGPTL